MELCTGARARSLVFGSPGLEKPFATRGRGSRSPIVSTMTARSGWAWRRRSDMIVRNQRLRQGTSVGPTSRSDTTPSLRYSTGTFYRTLSCP